ncbi:uncharacterized protein LY89DRAFT_632534 [Mollisia scopiformis]|uniref:Uncharacterized protein n=1 Tax=Mollisia scopiformis TaxID=149040 RepID=A0A132B3U2_MOLSC|nr:uncharacterized protein LY89DRAFT_632534 [Mollisia scopiformis]KUJ06699.1 hypothetical protein LY89DRAFT_632534 [Mollisia scopiformis]
MDEVVSNSAPTLRVPAKQIIAVEHPMIVQNLDNGIKTFGRNHPFERIVDSRDAQDIIPLYLRHDDPMCTPILSQNSPTNNVLLKITVPKRIGRKRKRGSQDPHHDGWIPLEDDVPTSATSEIVHSYSGKDKPASLLRKLQDTQGKYTVEVAGEVTQSHRYRGLSDFHHSTSQTEFMPKFRNIAFAENVDTLREFKFNPSRGVKENEEFFPPPILSSHQIPFNWGFHQNSNISAQVDQATGQVRLVNKQGGRKVQLQYLSSDATSIPMHAHAPPPDEPELLKLIGELRQAIDERPLWTRRALVNRVGTSKELWTFRDALQYIGYQFRGGPFRDALIKFGVDPRTDPKYRQYQSFFFKLFEQEEKIEGMQWKDVRTSYTVNKKGATKEYRESHIFDGKTVILDGKIWQVCDVTDPVLARLMRDAPYREKCETSSDGWFYEGTVAKIRAIMKTKLMAVCCKKELIDEEFDDALRVPDILPGKKSKSILVPLPKVGLTEEELAEMRKQGSTKAVQTSGVHKKAVRGKARIARIRKRVTKAPGNDIIHGNIQIASQPERAILPKPSTAPVGPSGPVTQPAIEPAAWNIPAPVIDPNLENLPASDRPLASIEGEAVGGQSRMPAAGTLTVHEEEEGPNGSDNVETDIEQDEIPDGVESEIDSDETDEVDYTALYYNQGTSGQ